MSTPSSSRARDALLKLTRPGGIFDYGPHRSRLLLRITRVLGQGRPLSAEQVDQCIAASGIMPGDAHAFLGQVADYGPHDTLVGILGLSVRETPHRFTVDGRQASAERSARSSGLPHQMAGTPTPPEKGGHC